MDRSTNGRGSILDSKYTVNGPFNKKKALIKQWSNRVILQRQRLNKKNVLL